MDQKLLGLPKLVVYYPEGHQAHNQPGHPERPERVERLRAGLEKAGWWDSATKSSPLPIPDEVLYQIHSVDYLNVFKEASHSGKSLDADTYTTPASWELAFNTAGGGVSVASAVWEGKARRGFALTRPPGHHATRHRGMGFCLLNNISLAAEYLCEVHNAGRVAIIDFDLHHGNGTQDIFYERNDIFYFSTHQYPYYPGTGNINEIGKGDGIGTNANFVMPPGSGDLAFESITRELIIPLLDRHAPEIVLVSFGFDPHWRDPLGHLQLSAGGYRKLIAAITDWVDTCCEGRIALFLEGGYDLDAAETCGQAVTSALVGEDWSDPIGTAPDPESSAWRVYFERAKQIWQL